MMMLPCSPLGLPAPVLPLWLFLIKLFKIWSFKESNKKSSGQKIENNFMKTLKEKSMIFIEILMHSIDKCYVTLLM